MRCLWLTFSNLCQLLNNLCWERIYRQLLNKTKLSWFWPSSLLCLYLSRLCSFWYIAIHTETRVLRHTCFNLHASLDELQSMWFNMQVLICLFQHTCFNVYGSSVPGRGKSWTNVTSFFKSQRLLRTEKSKNSYTFKSYYLILAFAVLNIGVSGFRRNLGCARYTQSWVFFQNFQNTAFFVALLLG